ncbi:hypothetical protein O0I10_008272 [Lichtheimia ornata]|uniref:Methyltransferase domain-containing protein n=1 Tax=Lichtheimia ornata TaxID=688661 RepID=A0AAD7UZG8_9FUNG|nr:uncharacterized protein O0I10_008272 [Lichtheimia ornata]KAJ8656050.1 hypothetical protein O0I10_008272 [Lichtheimia ornata]
MTGENTTPNQESGYDFKYGRRFHTQSSTVIPDDKQEQDRISGQHLMIKKMLGGKLFESPVADILESGTNVLDSGCGPGAWLLDMATTYPQSKYYGIDIAKDQFPAQWPSNANFTMLDITQLADHFPSNHFGFVYQRLVAWGIKDWDKNVDAHMQIVEPNGWMEFIETVIVPEYCVNMGPKMTAFINTLLQGIKEKQLDLAIGAKLQDKLASAGAINIEVRKSHLPLNHSGEPGIRTWANISMFLASLRPGFVKGDDRFEDKAYFDEYLAECGEECKEFQTCFVTYRISAQKPDTTTRN